MIKTLTNVLKQDKEKFAVPRKVQDIIPVRSIWPDGIFLNGVAAMMRPLISGGDASPVTDTRNSAPS